jgi:hypothetical protein
MTSGCTSTVAAPVHESGCLGTTKKDLCYLLMCRKADGPMEDEENMSQEKGSLADLQNFRDQ